MTTAPAPMTTAPAPMTTAPTPMTAAAPTPMKSPPAPVAAPPGPMPHLFGLQILHLVAVGDSRTGILVRWQQQPVSASGCGTSGAALALAASAAPAANPEASFRKWRRSIASSLPWLVAALSVHYKDILINHLAYCAHPEGRDRQALLLQLVGNPDLAPGRLLDRQRDHCCLDLRRNTVFEDRLLATDLLQRQLAAFVIHSLNR